MGNKIHMFDNGVKVYDHHLLEAQRQRYRIHNVHEIEEEELFLRLIESLDANALYINIGSAIGYYPILAKKRSPQIHVHVYEPLKVHRDYFSENIRLNGFEITDFNIHDEAISLTDGFASFIEEDYKSQLKRDSGFVNILKEGFKRIIGKISAQKFPEKRYIKVKTLSLDSMIKMLDTQINLIQMDIQGYELDALKSGRESLKNGLVESFLIGTHGISIHKRCIDILLRYNYQIEFDNYETVHQPDGIIVASKNVRRLWD